MHDLNVFCLQTLLIQISHSVISVVFGTFIFFSVSCDILCWALCFDVLCSVLSHLGLIAQKPVFGISHKAESNQSLQLQRLA